jgi:vitamin B12 transporter
MIYKNHLMQSSTFIRLILLVLPVLTDNYYCFAQINTDSVYVMPVMQVNDYRYNDFSAGSKSITIDSAYLKNNPGSLADVLSNQSSVYIKTYGVSSLASISVRGGSASQTQTTMNGMIMNSPTTGQLDYSTIPSFIFNNLQIQYGSQVSLMGSGAIGGSVHLSNQQNFIKRKQIRITYQQASFNSLLPIASIRAGDSTKQLFISAYYKQAQNNIAYFTNAEKKRIDHAAQNQKGVYVDYSFRIKNHTLKYWSWYQQMNRDLPGTTSAPYSDATQYDRNWKQGIQWTYAKKRNVIQGRLGYQEDKMNYESDTSNIHSIISSRIIQAELEYRYQLNTHVNLLAGSQLILQEGMSDNFVTSSVHQNKYAVFISSSIRFLTNKLIFLPSVRQEWCNTWVPFTPSLGINYFIFPTLKLHGLAGYNYRIPSLNDLYWNPGGNNSLKPEHGWGYEGGVTFEKKYRALEIYQDVTAYTRTISDWILWTPNNGIWMPDNIQRVWSRGLELESGIKIHSGRYSFHIRNSFAYTKSTNESDLQSTDQRLGKQLIYVPYYKNSLSTSIATRRVEAGMIYNYTSWSFITSDNSDYLNPYHLFDVFSNITLDFKKAKSILTLSARINNLFNTNYKVVSSRPMPMRNYQLTISYTFN